MKIVKPSVTLVHATPDPERVIERMGRICYQSNHKVKPCAVCEGSRTIDDRGGWQKCSTCDGTGTDVESARAFVKMVLANGHESVIEHAVAGFSIVTDRGVTHEIVRHRLASYSQESTRYCVAGNAKLSTTNPHNRPTIAELYTNRKDSRNGAWKRVRVRQLDESTGVLVHSHIEEIMYVGRQSVLHIRTRLGYDLEVTSNHEVLTSQGYLRAGALQVGGDVAVNGTKELYRNKVWLENQYTGKNQTAVEIAKAFGFNVSTVKKWVRKHALPIKPASYWNKGRRPWNKDLHEADDARIARQGNALRKYHWNLGRVVVPRAARVRKLSKATSHKIVQAKCELCGGSIPRQVHHVDENREHNTHENLLTVCRSCHQRVHTKNLMTVHYDRIVSIERGGLMDVYDIVMASPWKNFIANGVVVHNCNYSKEQFGKDLTFIEPPGLPEIDQFVWTGAMTSIENSYLLLIEHGLTPQIARSILPNSLKSEIGMTANFREWRHFLRLRTSLKAHPQMREVAEMIRTELLKLSKVCFEDIP
jgi:thymidylate synthase ThyX